MDKKRRLRRAFSGGIALAAAVHSHRPGVALGWETSKENRCLKWQYRYFSILWFIASKKWSGVLRP